MSGSTASPLRPQPLRLFIRIILIGALVLSVAHWARRPLAEPLLPLIAWSVNTLDPDFRIASVDLATSGPNEMIRVRANLIHPVPAGPAMIAPFGWQPGTDAWYQTQLLLGGIYVHCLLLAVLVLAWPAATLPEMGRRIAWLAPMLAVLLFIDVPFTVMAELRYWLHRQFDPYSPWPILMWSYFLMGGGGFMIAAAMALATIRLAAPTQKALPLS